MPPKRRAGLASASTPTAKRPRRTVDASKPAAATPAAVEPTLKPKRKFFPTDDEDTSSSASLTSSEDEASPPRNPGKDNEEDGDDVDEDAEWEDVLAGTVAPLASDLVSKGGADLELTFGEDDGADDGPASGKKRGASAEQRRVRMLTHCMHVQFLVYHAALRNAWANDAEVHALLLSVVPPGIFKDVERYQAAAAMVGKETARVGKKKAKGKGTKKGSEEPVEASPANDKLVKLLGTLIHWWKKRFHVTAPGLRKNGYKTHTRLAMERSDPDAPKYLFTTGRKNAKGEEVFTAYMKRGEEIGGIDGFRELAGKCEGSRDTGAVLFTALLRALGFGDARMVASLQPLGFGFSEREEAGEEEQKTMAKEKPARPPKDKKREDEESEESGSALSSNDSQSEAGGFIKRKNTPMSTPAFDSDLTYPHFWTELYSPHSRTHLAVSSLTLTVVGHTPQLLAKFSPPAKSRQVHAYILSFSADRTAKDVTIRYLPRRQFPGKTKPVRVLPFTTPIYNLNNEAVGVRVIDWWAKVLRPFLRPPDRLTDVDHAEEAELTPAASEAPKRKQATESVSGYKTHPTLTLLRHLKREEALVPGAVALKTLKTKTGDEAVYRRADIVAVKATENWYKEGRVIRPGEQPLKTVKRRAVTAARKASIASDAAEGLQGLFSESQTELFVPPPVGEDGEVPRNEHGNVDLFVPSMLPAGAVHVPLKGAGRTAKRLGVSYADAVVGFEFRKQRAVPVVEGCVVAKEMQEVVRDAWRAEEEERVRKEIGKREKEALGLWKRFLVKLRVLRKFQKEYGEPAKAEQAVEALGKNGVRTGKEAVAQEGKGNGFVPEDTSGGFLAEPTEAGGFFPAGSPPSPTPSPPPDADDDVAHGGGGFILDLEDDHAPAPTKPASEVNGTGPTLSLRETMALRRQDAVSGDDESGEESEQEQEGSNGEAVTSPYFAAQSRRAVARAAAAAAGPKDKRARSRRAAEPKQQASRKRAAITGSEDEEVDGVGGAGGSAEVAHADASGVSDNDVEHPPARVRPKRQAAQNARQATRRQSRYFSVNDE